eukprot:s735_g17.t1
MARLPVFVEAAHGRIFRLETSEGETLSSLQSRLYDVLEDANKGGRRMLSLGPLQFKGHETIVDAVENYTAEMAAAGRSFADPTFALVDYSELMNSKRSPFWIPDTAYRGMTLQQLHEVLGFMGHQAFAWHEAHRGSPSYGCRIPEEKFNLYHASYWIINPATQGYGLVGCSLVELIAEDAELQKPRWFVSHAWLEPITLFVANLSRHAHVRQLELDTAFWVCAYANNQHHLEADVGENPRRSSFYRAMQRCEGVVLLLDDQATPFLRIWCCFEEAIAVEKRNGTERRHKLLLDVCATDADGVAHVITDGLAGIENQMVPLLGLHHKTCREMTFPMHILQKALRINILSATASHEADRTRILNSIAYPHARLEELSATPPQEHEKYQTVNCALSAQFALASWCNSILHGWDPTPLAKALLHDTSRRMVQLSFTGCIRLYDSDLSMLVNHLPLSLEVLRLDLGFTGLVTLEPMERLGQCNSLVHLELRFPGCKHLESVAGLGAALQEMSQLRLLALWFSKLMNLESIEGLDEALPNLTSLECLAMNLDRCPKVPLASRKALYRGVKSLRRRQGILESWVHIQDVDQENLIMRLVKRCTSGTKPQKPSPWHSEKNPVLLGSRGSEKLMSNDASGSHDAMGDVQKPGLAPSPQLLRARLLLQLVAESSVRPEPRWQRRIVEAVNQVARSQHWTEALHITEGLGDGGASVIVHGLGRLSEQLQRSKIQLHSEVGSWHLCVEEFFRGIAAHGTGALDPARERTQPAGRFELLKRPLLQTLRALVTSAAWRDALELLRGAAAQLGSEVLSRRTLCIFALGAIAYGNVPEGSLLEQRLDEVYAKSSLSWVRATSLLREMRSTGLRVGLLGSALLLTAAGRNSPWRAALSNLRRREAEGMRLDDVALRKMLKGLSASRAWRMASLMLHDQLLQLRFSRRLLRRGQLATAALQAAASAAAQWVPNSAGAVLELLEDSQDAAAVSQKTMLEAAMSGLARSADLQKALELMEDSFGRQVQVSGVAHSFAMHAAALRGRWSTAFVLYDAMRQCDGRPSSITINNLALALRRLRGKAWSWTGLLLEDATEMDVFNEFEMRVETLRCNVVFLGNAVQSCSTCHHWSNASQLCQEISQLGVRCDAYVLSNVMSGMGRMVQWRPQLTNTALSALAAAGQDVLAQKLLRDMPRAQVRRDVISLACLTKAFEARRPAEFMARGVGLIGAVAAACADPR